MSILSATVLIYTILYPLIIGIILVYLGLNYNKQYYVTIGEILLFISILLVTVVVVEVIVKLIYLGGALC